MQLIPEKRTPSKKQKNYEEFSDDSEQSDESDTHSGLDVQQQPEGGVGDEDIDPLPLPVAKALPDLPSEKHVHKGKKKKTGQESVVKQFELVSM